MDKCVCGTCRTCRHREYMRVWRGRNPEKDRAASRSYYQRHKHEWAARFRDPEKARVRAAVKRAVKAGRLIPQPCEICGGGKAEAHHDDYTRPLDVRWLCRPHHSLLHRIEAVEVAASTTTTALPSSPDPDSKASG